MRSTLVRVALAVLACAALAAPTGQVVRSPGNIVDSPMDNDPVFLAKRERALNEARQKSLVADTAKLLALARALDDQVQAGGGEELTAAQRAQLAQIEKLAHRVKEKMAESDTDILRTNPLFTPPAR